MERRPAYDENGCPLFDREGQLAYVWDANEPNRKAWFFRCMEWLSQGINVFLGGHQDLTFSQRVGGWQESGYKLAWMHKPIDFIFGKDHCRNAWREKV